MSSLTSSASDLLCAAWLSSAVCEFWGLLADQPQPGLVNESGGLEGLASRFVGHPGGCQFAQLLIDERQEFVRGLRIASLDSRQDMSDVADASVLPDSAQPSQTISLGGWALSCESFLSDDARTGG